MNLEATLNTLLADLLRSQHPRWRDTIRSQQTRRVVGAAGLSPDVEVLELGVTSAAPVLIEAEVEPARSVEDEARGRLGLQLQGVPLPVETVVALRYPARLRNAPEGRLRRALAEADDLAWAVWQDHQGQTSRTPSQGWVTGTVSGMADTLDLVAHSPRLLEQAVASLESGVAATASHIGSMNSPLGRERIAEALHQEAGEQTWRMAASILVNAFLFQETLAGHLDGVPTIAAMRSGAGADSARAIRVWSDILRINYYPIFHIARQIAQGVPSAYSDPMCQAAAGHALSLSSAGLVDIQGVSGQMFGQLISDRKFLATFYTLPTSAVLLAELVVSRLEVDWADLESVSALRVADFACGTGALLSAVYQRIAARVHRAGGDAALVHQSMMERGLIGVDIMPAAAHLTTTMLSSEHPGLPFEECAVHVAAYQGNGNGRQALIGSLELLGEQGARSLFRQTQQLAGSRDTTTDRWSAFDLSDGSCDLVIMNPPFTRPTNHERADELKAHGEAVPPVPSFAGFGTSEAEQRVMSDRLKRLTAKAKRAGPVAGNGYAGLGSNFMDLAHAKLRPGGALGLVLPLTFATGASWKAMRDLLDSHYDDLRVVSVADPGGTSRAFSADTGMAEVLIVATKRTGKKPAASTPTTPTAASWTALRERPPSRLKALWLSQAVSRTAAATVKVGDETVGYSLAGGAHSGLVGFAEPEVAVCAQQMAEQGVCRLPRVGVLPVPLCALGDLGRAGPVDRSIHSPHPVTGAERALFGLEGVEAGRAARVSYPILWAHDAASGRESAMLVAPDFQARPAKNRRDEADRMFQSHAARLHLNRDFQLNSQPLAACLTPGPSLGGTAWPTFKLAEESWEPAVCVWLNSTLGLAGRWLMSSRQQQGRARLTVSTLVEIPVLDPRTLTAEQLDALRRLFNRFKHRRMLPANEAYRDRQRQLLDRWLLRILGADTSVTVSALRLLRRQWCAEPSVHGGKSTRP